MTEPRRWITAADLGLLTDRYELSMLQAYWASGMRANATFSLYFRKMPGARRFMLACGQRYAAQLITQLRYAKAAIDELSRLGDFQDAFLRWLEDFRFTGDILAMPEGTPVFPEEPLLEVTGPIAEAQLLETLIMNLVHLETVLASKAIRMVIAADGRPVVDFGMRRMHGIDAAIHGVRAYRTAGIAGTSHVLAGLHFGLPVSGTMAHSYIQVHDDESAAFKAYADLYPGTTLLVDTYDSLAAVDRIVALHRRFGKAFEIGAIRLDSGDLAALSHEARQRLDAAGLHDVRIFASGGLDEHKIASLVAAKAPIDAFGVGTALGTSADAPSLDLVYKLTTYNGIPRLKNSPGKQIYPGAKQVFRSRSPTGEYEFDEVTLRDERRDAEPLLVPIVSGGTPLPSATPDAATAASYAKTQIDSLPPHLRAIDPGGAQYDVRISRAVQDLRASAMLRRQRR
jgi:nicotinate phosphoribosyltransferase